jgi:hypothetical protein
VGWINLQNASGSGNGQVTFNVDINLGPARSATIVLLQGNQPSCTVNQAGLLHPEDQRGGAIAWESELNLHEGEGQIVVDGTAATFQSRGFRQGVIEGTSGPHRVEATVVTAAGRSGTWRFRLAGLLAPGSLRVVAGVAVSVSDSDVVFRLSGQAGERILFAFRVR